MSDKIAAIPQDVKKRINEYVKASLPAWYKPRQVDAEFGYSLAQQEIAELKSEIGTRDILLQAKYKEIERLKGLLKAEFRSHYSHAVNFSVCREIKELEDRWNEFKTENNL